MKPKPLPSFDGLMNRTLKSAPKYKHKVPGRTTLSQREAEWKNAVNWLLRELEACKNLSSFGSAGGPLMKSVAIKLTRKAFEPDFNKEAKA